MFESSESDDCSSPRPRYVRKLSGIMFEGTYRSFIGDDFRCELLLAVGAAFIRSFACALFAFPSRNADVERDDVTLAPCSEFSESHRRARPAFFGDFVLITSPDAPAAAISIELDRTNGTMLVSINASSLVASSSDFLIDAAAWAFRVNRTAVRRFTPDGDA